MQATSSKVSIAKSTKPTFRNILDPSDYSLTLPQPVTMVALRWDLGQAWPALWRIQSMASPRQTSSKTRLAPSAMAQKTR